MNIIQLDERLERIESLLLAKKKVLTLEETIRLARENSRNAKQAETSRTLGYWSYQVYKS